jgi:hypothetical protein
MEVHHHPIAIGSSTPRKKWTHYFWEFFMLFLAVTLGFFVENEREHFVEHRREKQFIFSMCEDLKSDTFLLHRLVNTRQTTIIRIDSLIYYLKQPNPDDYGKFIYYYGRAIAIRPIFVNTDRTIQQLKNAGNLRLIRNQSASDSLIKYDWEVRRIERTIDREDAFLLEYIETLKQLFDGTEFDKMMTTAPPPFHIGWNWPEGNPPLLRKDKESLQKLINNLHFVKSINIYNVRWSNEMIGRASRLSEFLKKEYHLK